MDFNDDIFYNIYEIIAIIIWCYFMKSTLGKRSFQAIYRYLDKFNPISSDCGALCGSVCCVCRTDPDDTTPHAETDENADYSMGLYLLPGEEQMYTFDEDWISWG